MADLKFLRQVRDYQILKENFPSLTFFSPVNFQREDVKALKTEKA
jgi:hypothetical protein